MTQTWFSPTTISPVDTSGPELATLLTNAFASLLSSNSGASAPAYAVTGAMWVDTSVATAHVLKVYDGAQWVPLITFNPTTDRALPYGGAAHGQCRLIKSGANLALMPFDGDGLIINGKLCTIPAAGVTLAPTGEPARATTNRVRTSNVNTLTIGTHNIQIGDKVGIKNVGGTAYNGWHTVTARTSTTISYAMAVANEASTADTGGTVYLPQLIFARDANGDGVVDTLEATPLATGHVTHTDGVEIKTGDPTRTLVGMAIALAGPAWEDTLSRRFVLNWFNRQLQMASGLTLTLSGLTGSGVIDRTPANKAEYLAWTGDATLITCDGFIANTTALAQTFYTIETASISFANVDLMHAVANAMMPLNRVCMDYGNTERYEYASWWEGQSAGTGSGRVAVRVYKDM